MEGCRGAHAGEKILITCYPRSDHAQSLNGDCTIQLATFLAPVYFLTKYTKGSPVSKVRLQVYVLLTSQVFIVQVRGPFKVRRVAHLYSCRTPLKTYYVLCRPFVEFCFKIRASRESYIAHLLIYYTIGTHVVLQ